MAEIVPYKIQKCRKLNKVYRGSNLNSASFPLFGIDVANGTGLV